MHRLYPYRLSDPFELSRLLELYLQHLAVCALQVDLKQLSYDTRIPEAVFQRLCALYRHPEDAPNILVTDFHIVFANVMFRYPTIKIWRDAADNIFFEI